MIPKEILQKVRRIEITTSRLVTDVFAGQYHSIFKGRGMEFDEVREDQIGDDIRTIDWNVTARTGRPHIKKYVEERELTVMVMVDLSASCRFASVNTLKHKLAAEIAAVLAFSAVRNNDKVGLLIFTDEIEKFIPPRKGRSHVLRVIREVLYFQPHRRGTDITHALDYLNRVTTRRAVAFLISDFLDPAGDLHGGGRAEESEAFRKALSIANKRHDLIGITLNDPREVELPDCGLLALEDAEQGEEVLIDSGDRQVREEYRRQGLRRLEKRRQLFGRMGMDHIDVSTDLPYADAFIKFFRQRRRRT